MSGWVGPSVHQKATAVEFSNNKDESCDNIKDNNMYRSLVVDSGPIIRRTGLINLRGKAHKFYTVPAVLQEIRDAKARDQLDQLPFELIPREASAEGIQAIIEFSRQTGDYQTLSTVDLQVLALLYDLEKEGCGGNVSHIRTTPKRTVGVGRIQSLSANEEKKEESTTTTTKAENNNPSDVSTSGNTIMDGKTIFESTPIEIDEYDEDEESDDESKDDEDETPNAATDEKQHATTQHFEDNKQKAAAPVPAKTWAMLVNPDACSNRLPKVDFAQSRVADAALSVPFGKMSLGGSSLQQDESGGQFSDAEDDDADSLVEAATGRGIRDENKKETKTIDPNSLEAELQSDFPSLQASLTVPYERSDDEGNAGNQDDVPLAMSKEEQERRKEESLRPVSKSGKLYNSFRKYENLMKAKPVAAKTEAVESVKEEEKGEEDATVPGPPLADQNKVQSRIIGGMGMAGQEEYFDDDGEGWITCTRDIQKMKAAGHLDPQRGPSDNDDAIKDQNQIPISQRTACATTDFAMQNVILQMSLELLSVDGIKIRRLKSWVTRCGACFKVFADGNGQGPHGMKRLFCSHCGSDMMQRIAASVDGKTGRLRLHMSKKHKNNLRGTKFSLPKPGTANRFQGDLLLREDQLMMGAWNQKVKIRSGGKSRTAAQSIFGKDLASNVGCKPQAINHDDIQVGFGRRNPNAAKGRERRGKKKKSSDKACGLRRY